MTRPSLAFVAAASILLSCDGGGDAALLVDLQTDLQPGIAFDAVRISVGDRLELRPVTGVDDFATPARVADLEGLTAGDATLSTELLRAGTVVVRSDMVVRVEGTVGVIVVITRSCVGVSCPDVTVPTTCLGGTCVPRECSNLNRLACGTPTCDVATDCAGTSRCARAACAMGVCLLSLDDSLCDVGQVCEPSGCREDGVVDGGAPDAPPPDAAADTSAGTEEVCNGIDDDLDLAVDEGTGGVLPTACWAFGATGAAAAYQGLDANNLRFSLWTATEAADVVALWALLRPASGAPQPLRAVVYSAVVPCVSAACGAIVEATEEVFAGPTGDARWVRFPFSGPVRVDAGEYHLGIHSAGPDRAWFYNNEDGGPGWYTSSPYLGGTPGVIETSSRTTGTLTIFAERAP